MLLGPVAGVALGYRAAYGTGSGCRSAVSASSTMAQVQPSGATETGCPLPPTCSGSAPAAVRCAASQSSQAVAAAACPDAASYSAKKPVAGVQAAVRSTRQVVPGRIPPSGSVRALAARATAPLTMALAGLNGGPRKVTAASGPFRMESAGSPACPASAPVPNRANQVRSPPVALGKR